MFFISSLVCTLTNYQCKNGNFLVISHGFCWCPSSIPEWPMFHRPTMFFIWILSMVSFCRIKKTIHSRAHWTATATAELTAIKHKYCMQQLMSNRRIPLSHIFPFRFSSSSLSPSSWSGRSPIHFNFNVHSNCCSRSFLAVVDTVAFVVDIVVVYVTVADGKSYDSFQHLKNRKINQILRSHTKYSRETSISNKKRVYINLYDKKKV